MSRTKAQILQAIETARDQFLASIWGRAVRRGMGDIADAVYDAVLNQLLTIDSTLTESGAGADAKTTGERIAAIEDEVGTFSVQTPANYGVLPSGDLHSSASLAITGNAIYILSASNTYTNAPVQEPFDGVLLQLNNQDASGKKKQIVFIVDGRIYIDEYDGTYWSDWLTDGITIDSTLSIDGAAADAESVGTALSRKADASSLADVATSGSYNDLNNKPTLSTVARTGNYGDLNNTPTLSAVAITGSYDSLTNKPSIPALDNTLTQQNCAADAKTVGDALGTKANTSSLATVATSGSYNDLLNQPSIPLLDTTLAISGRAADAKATGDAIAYISSTFVPISSAVVEMRADVNALKVDYITENGASGNWIYRKWKSGLCEMWAYNLTVDLDGWTQTSDLSHSWTLGYFNFPLTLSDTNYSINIAKTFITTSPTADMIIYGAIHHSASRGGVRLYMNTSESRGVTSVNIDVYVFGRWQAAT